MGCVNVGLIYVLSQKCACNVNTIPQEDPGNKPEILVNIPGFPL